MLKAAINCLMLLLVWVGTVQPLSAAPPEQENDSKARADALYNEGSALHRAGEYQAALKKFQAALALYRETGSRPEEGSTLNDIGLVYEALANYEQALAYYQQALPIWQELGQREKQAWVLNNIGWAYDNLSDYEQALAYYQQALPLWREVGHQEGEAQILHNMGLVYGNLSDYEQALTCYQQALPIWQELGQQEKQAWTLNNIGWAYQNLSDYEQALAYYQQALSIWQEIGDREGEAQTLHNMGVAYDNLSDYEQALTCYQQALPIWQELGQQEKQAWTLHNIGLDYDNLSDYEQALTYSQQALSLWQKLGHREQQAWALNNAGWAYQNLSDYEQALAYYQQALAIWQEIGHQEGEALTLNNIGLAYQHLFDYKQALAYYQRSLAVSQESGDRETEAKAAHNIGWLYIAVSDYKQALTYNQKVLDIWQELGNRAQEAGALLNIGLVYDAFSNYEQALVYYQRALDIWRELGQREEEADALHNIGMTYQNLGQYQEALKYYEESLAIKRAIGDRQGEGTTLNSIGNTYLDLGQYQTALKYYEEALAIKRERGDQAWEEMILVNIGIVYWYSGQYQTALEHYEKALATRREVSDRAGEGLVLINIGAAYKSLGQAQEALKYYEEALIIKRETGERHDEAIILDNMGRVYYALGQKEKALATYQEALAICETVRGELTVEELKTTYAETYKGLYERIILLLLELGRPGEAFHYGERARARAFLDQLGNQRVNIRTGVDANLLTGEETLRGEITALETRLQEEWTKPRPQRSNEIIDRLTTQLGDKRDAYEQHLIQLKLHNPEYASLISVNPLTLAEVQALLDKQTVLIEYFVTRKKTLIFIVSQDDLQVIEVEISREKLTGRVSYLRHLISFRQLQTEQESAQGLYDLLVKPVEAHLQSEFAEGRAGQQWGIIPHGPLHYLPFAALWDGETYLIQQHPLFFLPGASVLQFVLDKRKPGADTLLCLGNPTTDLPPLPFAEEEAQAIAAIYGTTPLLGSEASEHQLRVRAADYGLVHIAAHGSFNIHNPLFSALHLAADNEDDGRLELHEVYGLDLKRADLVVLSACETQIGQITAGDEIIGLNRAFIFAGTPTVVASLWNVNDEATSFLMERFYTHLKEGTGKAEALRQAQLETMAAYPDPYYWAAFVLSGDGGQVIGGAEMPSDSRISTLWLIGIGVVAAVIIVGGLTWRRRNRLAQRN